MKKLPGIREICLTFADLDPIDEPIPVRPAAHYTMGGIDCNSSCETVIRGLYAAGECSCISVHGANRLGGNSLLECVVFGKVAGEKSSKFSEPSHKALDKELIQSSLEREEKRIEALQKGNGAENPTAIRDDARVILTEKVGIFRSEPALEEALQRIRMLKTRLTRLRAINSDTAFNLDLVRALEVEAIVELSEIITASALQRLESRGAQLRLDCPERDDEHFLKHTLAHYTPAGPVLEYSDVRITRYKPEARKY